MTYPPPNPYGPTPPDPYAQSRQPQNPYGPDPYTAAAAKGPDEYARPSYGVLTPKPDSYLVWAIVATVLCCLPFGIPGIYFAARVDGLWRGGQYAEAQDASRKARAWCIAAVVAGVASIAVSLVFQMALFSSI
jgi:hypothetical protein